MRSRISQVTAVLLCLAATSYLTPRPQAAAAAAEDDPLAGISLALDAGSLHLVAGRVPLDPKASLHASRGRRVPADGMYVIQLTGPVTPDQRAALAGAGLRLGQYLPVNAFIVRLAAGTDLHATVGRMPFVRWVGPFEKRWKTAPEFGSRVVTTPERIALSSEGRMKVVAALFEGESLDAGRAALAAIPGVIITDATQSGENGLIELTVPRDRATELVRVPAVQFLDEAPEWTLRNNTNSWILQTNVSGVTSVWAHGVTGAGQIGGHIDGGIRMTHCMFDDPGGNPIGPLHRKVVAYFGSTAVDSHGTHTAGTFAGDEFPINGTTTFRGMAYGARLAFTNLGTVTSTNLLSKLVQNHGAGGRVHSNSWGDDSTTNYISWTRDVDQFSYANEDDLVLFAVTNLNARVKTPENAKNCLAVAAGQDTPNQGNHCSGGFSQTQDGRFKPEVMAPGCSTQSASGFGASCAVAGLTGTSMACPAVAGAAVLVRDYFMQGFYPTGAAVLANALTPSGALMKAVLINGAVDMTGITGYPSTREGFGRVLLDNALYFAGDARRLRVLDDIRNASGLVTGNVRNYTVTVNSNAQPFEVTLVWTDKEAALNANPAYINNLNLEVTDPSGTLYRGNRLAGGQSLAGAAAPDNRNNTEMVVRNTPVTGNWTVTVRAASVSTPLPQGFALVATGDIQ